MGKAPDPWVPAKYGAADAAAVRACAGGVADADQQRRAMRWIIEKAAGAYQPSYRPSERDTAFAEGRRSVGLNLVTIITMPAELLAKVVEVKDVGRANN